MNTWFDGLKSAEQMAQKGIESMLIIGIHETLFNSGVCSCDAFMGVCDYLDYKREKLI